MSRPYKVVGSNAPVFDGNEACCWFVKMTSNCNNAILKNVTPGTLYSFVFTQDAVGGNTFVWPNNCINPPEINTAPNAIFTANFVGMVGGKINSDTTGARTP